MTGIDTNVIVRYITQDGNEVPAATAFIESKISEESPGYICLVVLCELIWVLRRAYRYDRTSVCRIIEKLLSVRELVIEREEAAWEALQQYSEGSADFSDYLIVHIHAANGADTTVTFDRKASEAPQFTLLESPKSK